MVPDHFDICGTRIRNARSPTSDVGHFAHFNFISICWQSRRAAAGLVVMGVFLTLFMWFRIQAVTRTGCSTTGVRIPIGILFPRAVNNVDPPLAADADTAVDGALTDHAKLAPSTLGHGELYTLPRPFYLHYVKFLSDSGKNHFRFTDFLSVMSAIQYLKPDKILVHGDAEPQGDYWERLSSGGLVSHMYRAKPTKAGQRQGKPKPLAYVQHAADMTKLDVLLEYGGVAVDFDVYFVRGEQIRKILRQKKAILCFGDIDGYSISFVAAQKDSKLLYAWRRSYEDIYVNDWNFNQGFVAKYLAVLFRDETYVADRICNNPHPDRDLDSYFHNYGRINWKDSIAIHSFERLTNISITTSADLDGTLTTHKELLRTIYGNLSLPEIDVSLREEIDPLTSELL